MANTDSSTSWDKIQKGVKDAERLIGQKDYSASMMKARQTLEFMVKILAERASIADSNDLMTLIDALYQNRLISKISCEHYHKIRMIGNRATHEGDNNAYNANQAYHLLSQEVYSFANDYRNTKRGSSSSRSSSNRTNTRSRKKTARKKKPIIPYDFLKLLVPVLCIILLILVIKLLKPVGQKKDGDPTTAPVTTEATIESTTTTESVPESSGTIYKTTTTINVRSQPTTDTDRIAKLDPGVEVEYVRAHDDTWAVILYQGKEAYVSSQYLTNQ